MSKAKRMSLDGIRRAIELVGSLKFEPMVNPQAEALAELRVVIATKQDDGVRREAILHKLMAAEIGVSEWSLRRLIGRSSGAKAGAGRTGRGSVVQRARRARAEGTSAQGVRRAKPLAAGDAADSPIVKAPAITSRPAGGTKVDLNKSGFRRTL